VRVHQLSRRPTHAGGDESGAVAVVVALLSVVLLILAAFAVDIGNAYAQTRQQSVAVDAAALAAAARVGEKITPGVACTPAMLTSIDAQGVAQTTADDVNRRNSKPGVTEADTTVTVACSADGKAVEVAVVNSHPVKTQLAGIIGIDQINTGSSAVARYIRVSSLDGLRPWAICDGTVTDAQKKPLETFATGLDNKIGICSSQSSGNWGSIDFNGGGNGAGDLADWTLEGYPDPVDIPGPLPADPGVTNSSALRAAFASLVGQIVQFPSVSGYNTGNGNTGSFDAVGIATVQVCGILYGNDTINTLQNGSVSDCWVDPRPTSSTSTTTATKVTTGTTTSNGNGGNRVTTLTITDPEFDCAVPLTGIEVTIPGAARRGQTPIPLVSTLRSCTGTTTATLDTPAAVDVTDVSVTVKTTSTTTTYTPGIVPLDNNNKPVSHIQFRWVNYAQSWQGSSSSICPLTNPQCVGVTQLWK
jgi:Flp pilus assembly protein TadG